MSTFLRKNKSLIIAAIIILAISIFLRIYNLIIIPVFADEAIYIRWAQVMRAESTLRFLPLTDGKQPLFMWSVIPFLKLISDPLVAGRIVSVLSGLGSLIGVFTLSFVLFKSVKISLFSALIYAVTPFSVFFDRLALADSMLTFFGIWTLVFAIMTTKKVRLDTAMLSGFSLGGALLTKSPAIYFALMLPLNFIFIEWSKKFKEKFIKLSVFVFLFFFTYVISFAMYNILRLGSDFHMIAIRNKDYVYPVSHIFSSPLDPFIPFFHRTLEYIWILGPFAMILLILIGLYFGTRKYPKETFLLFVWGLLPILVSSEFSKTMTARYVYFSLPYYFVIAGFSLFNQKKGFFKNAIQLTLVIFVIHSLLIDFKLLINPQSANLPRSERSGYLEEWTSGYGIKEVSEYLKNEYKNDPAGKIVVGTEGYFGTLPDGLQIYLNDIYDITVIGIGQPIKEVPRSLEESKKAGNKTYLVVNSTRLLLDLEALGAKPIAKFPKAKKPDGEVESLLFYQL